MTSNVVWCSFGRVDASVRTTRFDSATVIARDVAPATSRRQSGPARPGPIRLSISPGRGQIDVARETHYRCRFVRAKLRSVIHRRRRAYR